MKSVLLDTNFILTCVKQKINFFDELQFMGLQILIPEQVINELKKLSLPHSGLTTKFLQKNKFKKIDIGRGHVDNQIISYAEQNPKIIVATLDREIKNKIKNKKLVIRGKKKLEVV
jgi:rRNA-processing protein FCF1